MTDPHGADSAEIVEVTQADRDAVQAFHREMGRRLMSDVRHGTSLLDAKGEDSEPVYQAFARHRIAALRTPPDDAVKLREALERVLSAVKALGERSPGTPHIYFDEHPMSEEGTARWIELNDAGVAARAALKGTPNDDQ